MLLLQAASMVPEYLTPTNGGLLSSGQLMALARIVFGQYGGPGVAELVLEITPDVMVGKVGYGVWHLSLSLNALVAPAHHVALLVPQFCCLGHAVKQSVHCCLCVGCSADAKGALVAALCSCYPKSCGQCPMCLSCDW